MVLERKFSWECFKNNIIFFHLSPTLSHFHPLQIENCGSNSRLVVDENDNGKLGLERVKPLSYVHHFYFNPLVVSRYRDPQGGGPRVVVSTAAFHARVRGSVPGLGGLKETKLFLPHPRVKVSIVGSLRDREVACSASDRQGSNFESCVWRTVSSQTSHHPQEVLLAQFSLYVHKGGLKPDSFHFISRPTTSSDWWQLLIYICLIWHKSFSNFDVQIHISFPMTCDFVKSVCVVNDKVLKYRLWKIVKKTCVWSGT